MKVLINRELCVAHGVCATICPEVYKLDADGFIGIAKESEVPPLLEVNARYGANSCPENVISIIE